MKNLDGIELESTLSKNLEKIESKIFQPKAQVNYQFLSQLKVSLE